VEPAAPGHSPEAEPEERVPHGDPTATQAPIAEPDPRADDESENAVHADPTWPTEDSGDGDDSDSVGHSEADGDTESDEESGNGFSLSHVPVKRKGSRKR